MSPANLARIISLLNIAFGVFALVYPQTIAEMAELHIGSGNGWSEIGALYGGMPIAIGLIGLQAARGSSTDGPVVLLALGVLWMWLPLGRLAVGFTAPLKPGLSAIGLGGLEVALGLAMFWSGWKLGYER